MPKPFVLFDIDNTMFGSTSYFPLLATQVKEELIGFGSAKQADASLQKYKSGNLEYEAFVKELLDIYALGLKGKPVTEVAASTRAFFSQQTDFSPMLSLL